MRDSESAKQVLPEVSARDKENGFLDVDWIIKQLVGEDAKNEGELNIQRHKKVRIQNHCSQGVTARA